jgi:hypothetical protein
MPSQQAVARRQRKLRPRRIDAGRQRVGNMDPPAGFPPPFIHYAAVGKCHAWRLVSASLVRVTQTLIGGPGPDNQTVLVKQVT